MKYVKFILLIAAIALASFMIPDSRIIEKCGFPTRIHAIAAMQSVIPNADEEVSASATYYNFSTGSYCYTMTFNCNEPLEP
jgi:hypothetical protein